MSSLVLNEMQMRATVVFAIPHFREKKFSALMNGKGKLARVRFPDLTPHVG